MSDNLRIVPVILAGGQGTRFWPISRAARPKQFLSISPDGESLIQATVNRLDKLSTRNDMIVVTNQSHVELLTEHVPECKVLKESIGKNTAASIGLAAIHLMKYDPKSIMAVFPADHYIKNSDLLIERIKLAATIANKSAALATIGITPTSPNTGYGYIKCGPRLQNDVFKVSRFYEKPSMERAREYLEEGGFFWNSGIFIWRPDVLLEGLKSYMPDLYKGLREISSALGTDSEGEVSARVFSSLDSISIDFGLLEHARNCVVVDSGDIGWSDVGSWDAWADYFTPDSKKNLLHGDAMAIDSTDCVVYSHDRMIAMLGCKDMVVIDSRDALLVCPRSRVQDVKDVVSELVAKGRKDLT